MGREAGLSTVDHVSSMVDADKYAVHNDPYVVKEGILKQEIVAQAADMEIWKVNFCKFIFAGKNYKEAAKIVKKRHMETLELMGTGEYKALMHRMNTLKVHQGGPTKDMRRNMLWRIAVDNQEDDPKESTKALSEIGKLDDPKEGGSGGGFGTINVIISSDVLKKGPLDV